MQQVPGCGVVLIGVSCILKWFTALKSEVITFQQLLTKFDSII